MPAAPTNPQRKWCRIGRTLARSLALLAVIAGFVAAAPSAASAEPVVGLAESFWVKDWDAGIYVRVQATARYVGDRVAVYVDARDSLSDFLVRKLGTEFDTITYQALTDAYGLEPSPGIDGDPRVVILIYDFHRSTTDGLFNSRDVDPQGWPYSNRREMFYVNLQAILYDPDNICALAAHEFAHLILYYRDCMLDPSTNPSFEPTWLVEGFSTYGEYLAGYDGRTNSQLLSFANDPDMNLTYWQGVRANYGASYSFLWYLGDREGADFIRALAEQPLDGVAGIDATLASTGSLLSFTDLFDDWVVAGFLDGHPPQAFPYAFTNLSVSARPVALEGEGPILGAAKVHDFGAVYLDFPATSTDATFQAVVDGADGAPLHAALLSWDSTGAQLPSVARFDLVNAATGGTMTVPPGYDRHTLAVWARGTAGVDASYEFRYTGCADPPAGVQFLDMSGSDTFYAYAASLLSRGVISGKEVPIGSGLWYFMGAEKVTRAQFAKMIMEATGLHTDEIDNPGRPTFYDVPAVYDERGYPYDYVEEAADLGIVTGYKSGGFGPSNPITRGQLVLMITRGAAAAGRPLPAYTGNEKVFADVPVSHPLYRQIMAAYTAGILSGSKGGDGQLYFNPYSTASRNHVAKMTASLIEHLEAGQG